MKSIVWVWVAALYTLGIYASPFNTLKDDRKSGRLVYVPLSLDQRRALLHQVNQVLSVWVNYGSKIAHYGQRANPFPAIQALTKTINTISDAKLQEGLSLAFMSMRDLHTAITKPGPYGCYTATTGLYFDMIESSKGSATGPIVVVTGMTQTQPVIDLLAHRSRLNVGATPSGVYRRALDWLNLASGAVDLLPSNDTLHLTMQRGNVTFDVVLNYVTLRQPFCWDTCSQVYTALTNITLPVPPDHDDGLAQRMRIGPPEAAAPSHPHKVVGADRYLMAQVGDSLGHQRDLLGLRSSPVPAFQLQQTMATSVEWGIYDAANRNLGVIRLYTFTPTDAMTGYASPDLAVKIIRDLLAHELSNTTAVVVDVRNNPGGIVMLAEALPQLFVGQGVGVLTRLLHTPSGLRAAVSSLANTTAAVAWTHAYHATSRWSQYTLPTVLDTPSAVNRYGQMYVRPVAVWTNGRCFSACDVFASLMQDARSNNRAHRPVSTPGPTSSLSSVVVVIGEDDSTGGSGAIVFQQQDLARTDPYDFSAIPMQDVLASGGGSTYANQITVGIVQFVRGGAYHPQLIEDQGVQSDIVVRPYLSDLLGGSNSADDGRNSQLDRISDALVAAELKRGLPPLHFVAEPFIMVASTSGLVFEVKSKGMSDIAVYLSTDTRRSAVLAAHHVSQIGTLSRFNLSCKPLQTHLGARRITLLGHVSTGQLVVETHRVVRTEPRVSDRFQLGLGRPFELSTAYPSSAFVGVYNLGVASRASDGWTVRSKPQHHNTSMTERVWSIGTGAEYANNVDSSLDVFFQAVVGTQIQITVNATVDVEPGFDFVYLSISSDMGGDGGAGRTDTQLLTSVVNGVQLVGDSERHGTLARVFHFTVASPLFTVGFRFVSDAANGMFGGVVLHGLRVLAL
ncbi:hypothetical protein BASA60_003315 [Batrachochytrium salamandrivorans]|nr:hypothetical protein BASA60_003315 [Batrachochytrium salamandrivorans]